MRAEPPDQITAKAWQMLADVRTSPMRREEMIELLILALRRQLQYLSYREQRCRHTAYDEVAHRDVEALARAIQRLARWKGQSPMSKFDSRTEPAPAPGDIKEVEFVMAELKPGRISIGWRLNHQNTAHFFFFDMTPQQAAETMKRIVDREITDQDIARLDWQAVYLPVEKGKKQ